jgi:hypothetical protein
LQNFAAQAVPGPSPRGERRRDDPPFGAAPSPNARRSPVMRTDGAGAAS